MGEKTYELKDKSTGFHDHETGLKIVRDKKAVVDMKQAGTHTLQAIQHGRLIEVRTPAPVSQQLPPGKDK